MRVKRTSPLSVDWLPQKHNTLVSSSATVAHVLRPRRSSLIDDNCEKLVFVIGNMHFLKGKWLCQRGEEEEEEDTMTNGCNEDSVFCCFKT